MATHSPVLDTAIQDTLPDDILEQHPNAERAMSDARKAETLPTFQPKASSIYSPLAPGCIRILHLRPAPRLEDPLVGTLEIVHLSDGTPYEALSYTWGNVFVNDEKSAAWIKSVDDRARYYGAFSTQPSKPGEISLCSSTIITTANLDAALKRLRASEHVRSLWIDALCIDQDNPDERSAQVAQIAQVFAHARRTIVWLGEDSIYGDGQFVFACCRKHKQNMSSVWRRAWRRAVERVSFKIFSALPLSRVGTWFFNIHYVRPLLSWKASEQVRQFGLFSARSYFSRLWCVQEVASADNVIVKCGDFEIPWSTYSGLFDHDVVLNFRAISKLPAITQGSEHTFDKLVECSGLQCLDERDHIYAISSLLRLCKDCPPIKIDYKLDWQTVFIDIARDYVMINGYTAAWDVLTVAAGRRDTELTSSLPSWVPDWRPRPSEIEGHRLLESLAQSSIRRKAAVLEQKCRDAGRNITVAFEDCGMRIDLWYCGQLGEHAKSKFHSGYHAEKLEQTFESSDYLYSLPPEYGTYKDPCLVLRSCAGGKQVFQAIAVVRRHYAPAVPPWSFVDILNAKDSFEEAMHRISII